MWTQTWDLMRSLKESFLMLARLVLTSKSAPEAQGKLARGSYVMVNLPGGSVKGPPALKKPG